MLFRLLLLSAKHPTCSFNPRALAPRDPRRDGLILAAVIRATLPRALMAALDAQGKSVMTTIRD
jgi:hypothetical protein